MAEFPSLPLFTSDYIADTRHLTAAQHGGYLLLLMMAWRSPNCCLPDDDAILSKFAAMSRKEWSKNKSVIMAFWTLNDGCWTQNRLRDELRHVEIQKSKNVQAGKASALKRLNRGATSAQSTLQPNDQHKSNENSTPNPNPIEEEKGTLTSSQKEARGTRVPDDFEPDASCHALAEELLLTADDGRREFSKFMDYWRAVPAAKGRKLDWQATFKNWLRTAAERKPRNAATSQPNSFADGFAKVHAVIDERKRRERGGGGEDGAENVRGLPGLQQGSGKISAVDGLPLRAVSG